MVSTKYYFADMVIKPPPFADQIFTQKVTDFGPSLFADRFRKVVFKGLP